MRSLQPEQRIRRWHTYLVVWRLHRALGLGLGALLVLLSLTGSVLVLHHEIEGLLGAPYRIQDSATGPRAAAPAWNDWIDRAATQAPPDYRAYRLLPPQTPADTAKLLFLGPDNRTRWSAFLDPRDGSLLWHGPDRALFTPWLLGLHMQLHAGPWGYAVTGVGGLALVLLGLSGLYLHGRDILTMWRRPLVRRGRGWRVWLRDLHTAVGVLTLYFSIVLGATGLAYAILILPGQLRLPVATLAPPAASALAPLDPILTAGQAALPGQTLLRASLPLQPGAPVRLLLLDRSAPVWAKFSTVDFDAASGRLLRVKEGRHATTAEKWRAILAPLHFGFYGAGWVKVAYVIGGLAPAVLAITGLALWWRRTHRRRRAWLNAPASPPADRAAMPLR